ncbi:MAG: adenine nucleotide alpha hydrolase family protein [Nanoarchaeota archaeon]|nr:adenine nucleotide alpha hydrolase family protein [Nanoarchaeota archaeon]
MMEYAKDFEAKVRNNIKDHALCSKKEKIFVACSGGKDSTTALYILKKSGYDVEGIIIDLKMGDWSQRNLENIGNFCRKQNIKLNVIDLREEHGTSICYLRSGIQERERIGNCTICGVVRRWILNRKARELGAAKLVTGHNLDDEAENIMMNLLKGKPELFMNMGPKTGAIEDAKFVQRIKPLYFCTNAEIRRYTEEMGWDKEIVYEPCPCSVGAFRRDVRAMLSELEKKNQRIKQNLVAKLLDMLPRIKEKYQHSAKLKYCKACGEPSRNDICKRCQLMKVMVR